MTEEDEAREYCLHHPLKRPRINAISVLCVLGLSEWGIRAFAVWLVDQLSTVSALLSCFSICYCIAVGVYLLIFGRWLAIGIVLLYQRYATEDMRRKCCCKPSCSEYAVLAFRKYGLCIGAYKTYTRLFHICRSGQYIIDYP